MNTQLDIFNQQDLSRGRHNENSRTAHDRLKPFKVSVRNQVKEYINSRRCTMEIAELLGKPLHKISGRFTALKALGIIKEIGRKNYKDSTYTVYSKKNND